MTKDGEKNMEIRAPAGNYSQALVSIENGCNALYGGLKKWSARSRAVNLSEDEYASLIKKCDDNNIKFYLIKIEGRLRSNEEIKSVLGKLEKSLEGKYIANDYGYSGYFAGAIPPEGIINDYNPENKYQIIENMIFTENDYMMSDNSGCRRFELGSSHNSTKYVYTMFNKEIKNNKTNISLRLNFSCDIGKKSLESISYTRQNGTRVVFDMKSKEANKTTIYLYQIIEILNAKIKENIYECKAIVCCFNSSISSPHISYQI